MYNCGCHPLRLGTREKEDVDRLVVCLDNYVFNKSHTRCLVLVLFQQRISLLVFKFFWIITFLQILLLIWCPERDSQCSHCNVFMQKCQVKYQVSLTVVQKINCPTLISNLTWNFTLTFSISYSQYILVNVIRIFHKLNWYVAVIRIRSSEHRLYMQVVPYTVRTTRGELFWIVFNGLSVVCNIAEYGRDP